MIHYRFVYLAGDTQHALVILKNRINTFGNTFGFQTGQTQVVIVEKNRDI